MATRVSLLSRYNHVTSVQNSKFLSLSPMSTFFDMSCKALSDLSFTNPFQCPLNTQVKQTGP